MLHIHSSTATIRRLSKNDSRQLRAHLTRLDQLGRRDRFGYAISERSLATHAERCCSGYATVYGYFESGVLRGAGELHLDRSHAARPTQSGELAFSIESCWRRCGVATRLMQNLLCAAHRQRVTQLSVRCANDNEAMMALIRRHAVDLIFGQDQVRSYLYTAKLGRLSSLRGLVNDVLQPMLAFVDRHVGFLAAASFNSDVSAPDTGVPCRDYTRSLSSRS